MPRFDMRIASEEKESLKAIARYYGFTITQLVKSWIEYGSPEAFRQAWKSRFGV